MQFDFQKVKNKFNPNWILHFHNLYTFTHDFMAPIINLYFQNVLAAIVPLFPKQYILFYSVTSLICTTKLFILKGGK